MNKSLRILGAAALLAAVPVAYAGGETCAATKSAKAGSACSATTAAKTDECCPSTKAQQVVLKVKESACNEATAGFSMVVAKLDGVKAVDTCGQSHMTKVSYDGGKVCSAKIMAALKDAGYHVEAQQVTLAVAGLAEGTCTDKLSKAFTGVQGVSSANVCSVGKHAVVEFNPEQVSVDKLIAAADAAGYKAAVEALN
ncbi:MAG: cation transporter [Limisphaerales bacterium]